ncbi:MAG: type II toxin-antitoxin system PemK/MazF family toxin [Actinobacteria bacterium]|nr:type II toxin-antitoxin system PemK/MazF family toxin [Actinomycetota bacterium]MBU1943943.1 type II toxin-antitoxin system PemK/MazF family toxin [Actinomycetota bacterium]MBU2686969.1 type II toxin-antitoxin system PemK/MazF family toxin [Actinomycetota bacterium]
MRRGEVWWAEFPQPIGRRPVLLLSRDAAYDVRTSVTVAPLTGTIRSIPSEVRLGRREGLKKDCVANLDDLQTVPRSMLIERLTTIPEEKMSQVAEAISFALNL